MKKDKLFLILIYIYYIKKRNTLIYKKIIFLKKREINIIFIYIYNNIYK